MRSLSPASPTTELRKYSDAPLTLPINVRWRRPAGIQAARPAVNMWRPRAVSIHSAPSAA